MPKKKRPDKEFRDLFAPTIEKPRLDGVLNFDGSCWPNPGPSKCAFIIRAGQKYREGSVELGQGTNNTAEYQGLIHGLHAAIELGVTHIEIYGDSQLVIGGVKKGPTKSGMPHLEKLKQEARDLLRNFTKAELFWIPREENAEADALTDPMPSSLREPC